jgi:hypothetical protein
LAAAFLLLAALTACSSDDRPTLAEATSQLVKDGDELLASGDLASSGSAKATEQADQDRQTSCAPDEVQRFFRAEGNFLDPPYRPSPHATVGLLRSKLVAMGYDEIVDNLDLQDEHLGVAVVRDPKARLTFMVTARTGQKPGILIVGKTECYGRDS